MPENLNVYFKLTIGLMRFDIFYLEELQSKVFGLSEDMDEPWSSKFEEYGYGSRFTVLNIQGNSGLLLFGVVMIFSSIILDFLQHKIPG